MLPASMEAKHNFTDISGDDSLEELLTPNSTMAIEHDLTNLYRPLKEGQPQPAPLPLGVAVVDASIMVFGLVFPRAAVKHRAQMLDHFCSHLKVCQTQNQNQRAEAFCLKPLASRNYPGGALGVRHTGRNSQMVHLFTFGIGNVDGGVPGTR